MLLKIINIYVIFTQKKTIYTNIGNDWRNYLLENLLGNKKII